MHYYNSFDHLFFFFAGASEGREEGRRLLGMNMPFTLSVCSCVKFKQLISCARDRTDTSISYAGL